MSIINLLRNRQLRESKVDPLEYSTLNRDEDFIPHSSIIETKSPGEKLNNSYVNTLSTEPIDKNANSTLKYRRIWQRLRWKVLMEIRMRIVIKDIQKYGSNQGALIRETQNTRIQDEYYRRKADWVHKVSSVTVTTRENPIVPKWIINPQGNFRFAWDLYIGSLLLYTAIVTPFVIAFIVSENWDYWFWIDFLIDISFLIDTVLNLNTAYFTKDDFLIFNRKKIILNYLFGWLLLDIIASIPFGMIQALISDRYQGDLNGLIKILKIKSIPRLFRFSKLSKLIRQQKTSTYFENIQIALNIRYSIMRLFSALSVIILSLHVVACLWFLTARVDDFGPNTWVVRCGYSDLSTPKSYLTSVYWAMTTLGTVGYGDITAFTNNEKVLAMLWMVCAVYFISFSIGSLSSMYANIDTMKNIIDHKICIADDFIKDSQISKEIKRKMIKTIRLSTEKVNFSTEDKEDLLNELPKSLRHEIAMFMHKGAIKKFSFFLVRDYTFIANVFPFLQMMQVNTNEMICNIGEIPHNLYFIVSGRILYIYGHDNIVYRVLKEGHYFGDIEVIKKINRKYGICAGSDTKLLYMTQRLLEKVQLEFPTVWKELCDNIEQRERKIIKALAEMKALVKANKSGLVKAMKAAEFKEIIAKEISEIENEIKEETDRDTYDFSKRVRVNEIRTLKEKLQMTSESLGRLESLIQRLDSSKENEFVLPPIKQSKANNSETYPS